MKSSDAIAPSAARMLRPALILLGAALLHGCGGAPAPRAQPGLQLQLDRVVILDADVALRSTARPGSGTLATVGRLAQFSLCRLAAKTDDAVKIEDCAGADGISGWLPATQAAVVDPRWSVACDALTDGLGALDDWMIEGRRVDCRRLTALCAAWGDRLYLSSISGARFNAKVSVPVPIHRDPDAPMERCDASSDRSDSPAPAAVYDRTATAWKTGSATVDRDRMVPTTGPPSAVDSTRDTPPRSAAIDMLIVVEGGDDDLVAAFHKQCNREAGCRPHVLTLTPTDEVVRVRLADVEFSVPLAPGEYHLFDPRTSLEAALDRAGVRVSRIVLALSESRWRLAPGAVSTHAAHRYLAFSHTASVPVEQRLEGLASSDSVELSTADRRGVADATRRELKLARRGFRGQPTPTPADASGSPVVVGPGHLPFEMQVGESRKRLGQVVSVGYRMDRETADAFAVVRGRLEELKRRHDGGITVPPAPAGGPDDGPPQPLGAAIVDPIVRQRISRFGALVHDFDALARPVAEKDDRAFDVVRGTLKAIETHVRRSTDGTVWLHPYHGCDL